MTDHAGSSQREAADARLAEELWSARFTAITSRRWDERVCDDSTSPIDATELRAESMKRLVQFAVLPTAAIEGDECCPLPKSLNAQTFIELALAAMQSSSSSSTAASPRAVSSVDHGTPAQGLARSDRRRSSSTVLLLETYASTQETTSLVNDTFWWIWLQHFREPDASTDRPATLINLRAIQQRLFSRIATAYVTLFARVVEISSGVQDRIFSTNAYPQMVAQAVYAVFYHSFPDSRHDKFGPLFRKDLLDTVTEWTNGIPARPTASLDWNLHILEGDPKDKRASDAGRDGAVPTTHDAMRTAAAAVVQGAAKKDETSLFNLHGNTPLFTRFMHEHGGSDPSMRPLLMRRTSTAQIFEDSDGDGSDSVPALQS